MILFLNSYRGLNGAMGTVRDMDTTSVVLYWCDSSNTHGTIFISIEMVTAGSKKLTEGTMLNIHKPNHKLLILVITSICSIGVLLGLLGFYYLTYTPELSHAETASLDRRTMANITYMQEITSEICLNSTLNQQYTLIDKRDGHTYTVARIKNRYVNNESNCWMTKNLDITNKTIDSTDSDMVSGSFYIPASNLAGLTEDNERQPEAYYDVTYGGYYNWYTAIAGSGATLTEQGMNAPSSICPKGWKLPVANIDGDFFAGDIYAAFSGLSAEDIVTAPYYFKYGSCVSNGVVANSSPNAGYYWTSTIYNPQYGSAGAYRWAAYILFLKDRNSSGTGGGIYTNQNSPGSFGFSVRCIARGGEEPNYDNVEIAVDPTISLDVADEVKVEKGGTNPSTADLKVKVSSNQPYVVKLSSDDSTMRSRTTNVIIPAKSGLLDTVENGWGIMKYDANEYTAITSTPELFYEAASPEVKELLLKVGISTAPDLPSGEYSTNITVTATQN